MSMRHKKLLLALLLMTWVLVAVAVWRSMRVPSSVGAGEGTRVTTAGDELLPEVAASMRLRLELLERDSAVPAGSRDLFSMLPLSDPEADSPGGAGPPAPVEPPVAAQLRYMGYVELGDQTIALLQDGSEMYLGREGERVGPGYLIRALDESSVEIEYRGARRRLPVYAPATETNGRRP